jgi:hypothetical protein
MFPRFAWVDPELTDGLALDVTLATGLDAINQAAESIWNKHMTPITEAFAQRALVLGFGALPRLLKDPADTLARPHARPRELRGMRVVAPSANRARWSGGPAVGELGEVGVGRSAGELGAPATTAHPAQ